MDVHRSKWWERAIHLMIRRGSGLTSGRFTAGSLGLVVRPDECILLVQPRYDSAQAWGLPGGMWKRGEEPVEGLWRELAEEIGLRGRLEAVPVAQLRQRHAPHLDFVFRVDVADDFEPTLARVELRRAQWFPPDALPELFEPAADAIAAASASGIWPRAR